MAGGAAPNNARTGNGGNAGSNNAPAGAQNSAVPAKKAEVSTTAEALAKEYKANASSMDKYKGKQVEISGKYDRSGGTVDSPELKFETTDSIVVTCKLSPSSIQEAAKLQKGQEIKMVGVGDPMSIIGPLFKDCQMAR